MPTVKAKKQFLHYFIGKYGIQLRECKWILEYLMVNEKMLKKTHFVSSIDGCKNALVVVSGDYQMNLKFRGVINNEKVDAEKMTNFIEFLDPSEDLYIRFLFPNPDTDKLHTSVLTMDPQESNAKSVSTQEKLAITNFLLDLEDKMRHTLLDVLIDEALDKKDKARFMELTSLIKRGYIV